MPCCITWNGPSPKALLINKDSSAAEYRRKAIRRGELIDKYCWNKTLNFYTDYNFRTQKQSSHINPCGMYPFCFINEHPDYMSFLCTKAAGVLREKLLKPGGIVTTELIPGSNGMRPMAGRRWNG
jgi:alpha,alpha-trehalase